MMTLDPLAQLKAASNSTHFMQQLRQRFESGQHDHEFYISKAIKTVNFDRSFESLQRLDQLVSSFKRQVGPIAIDAPLEPEKLNTLLLISSYLGQFIAHKTACEENWLSFEELKQNSDEFEDMPWGIGNCVNLNQNGYIILLVFQVQQHFSEQKFSRSISQNIETLFLNHIIKNAQQDQSYAQEMHAIQEIYQKKYDLFCGTSFQELVDVSNLDYSLASLHRVDELMREIRQNYLVSPEKFLSQQSHFYFLLFLAGYIGRVIAQHLGTSIRWYDHHQISRMVGEEVSAQLSTLRVAQVQHILVFALSHVAEFLFEPIIETTSMQYAQRFIDSLSQEEHLICYAVKSQTQQDAKSSRFYTALHQAGFLLGYVLQHIHGVMERTNSDESFLPTSLPPGTMFYSHIGDLNNTIEEFNANPQGFDYNVLAYEMYVCLPHLRTDAIAIYVRHFKETKVKLTIHVPFFQVFDYRGFTILEPYFTVEDSTTKAELNEILIGMNGFFEGINAFEQPVPEQRKVWKQHYHPKRYPYPEHFLK